MRGVQAARVIHPSAANTHTKRTHARTHTHTHAHTHTHILHPPGRARTRTGATSRFRVGSGVKAVVVWCTTGGNGDRRGGLVSGAGVCERESLPVVDAEELVADVGGHVEGDDDEHLTQRRARGGGG